VAEPCSGLGGARVACACPPEDHVNGPWPPRATRGVLRSMPRSARRWTRGPVTVIGADGPRGVGSAVSKSEGRAVVRNRIRRRLREAVRIGVDPAHVDGTFLVVGRRGVVEQDFSGLSEILREGFEELHVRRCSR
jgi:RNase P protein component